MQPTITITQDKNAPASTWQISIDQPSTQNIFTGDIVALKARLASHDDAIKAAQQAKVADQAIYDAVVAQFADAGVPDPINVVRNAQVEITP